MISKGSWCFTFYEEMISRLGEHITSLTTEWGNFGHVVFVSEIGMIYRELRKN